MSVRSRVRHMAALVEFLVGGGLGIFFHWGLHYKQASYLVFGLGIILSLATYLIREELAASRAGLAADYRLSHEVSFAISRVTEPECQRKAREIVAAIEGTISLLAQGYLPLEENEFYLECSKAADQARKTIRAVDPGTPGWSERSGLRNFYAANVRALKRGVRITRTFVLDRDDLAREYVTELLARQLRDGVTVRVTIRSELPSMGEGWCGTCTFNFALYDNRTVTEIYSVPGAYFGRKTESREEVEKYVRLLDLVEHNSHPAVMENGRIILR